MKTLAVIILLFTLPLFFYSCNEDDNDEIKKENILSIDGNEYNLDRGVIYKRTHVVGPPYNFDFDLITEVNNPGAEEPLAHAAAMEMFTETEDDLKPGTYVHNTEEPYTAGTFHGIIAFNINIGTEEGDTFYITTSGTILVGRPGSEYEFTIDVLADKIEFNPEMDDFIKTESDIEIKCYYKGDLTKKNF